jgi:hypothetical protein
MANTIQEAFKEYHSKIKLDFENNQELITKRDMIIDEIRAYLKKKADEEGIKISFTYENQGSYSMSTGIEPLPGEDYDIDIMLLFNISKEDYTAKEVKQWVYDALNKYPRTVSIKKPCVRVQYHQSGETLYHVDLAVYSNGNDDDNKYLSKKPKYASDNEEWEDAEPKKLKKLVNEKYSVTEERHQFKRCIRYLKRWKDLKFKYTEGGRPTGISITALALNGFLPNISYTSFTNTYKANDIQALKDFINYILNQFSWPANIEVKLPVKPYNNLFEKMTDTQKVNFKNNLTDLKEKLNEADNETDPNKASKILITAFGKDFPEITKKESALVRTAPAIVSSPDQA